MVSPYRAGEPPKALSCPRCAKALPPMDVAVCTKGCGTWVSQFASSVVLTDVDRRLDPVTRWWRVRAPCPVCAEKMKLCGEEPGLLQGCELHGYFVDADVVKHTGLAKGVDQAALERKRENTAAVDEEREQLAEAAEKERQRKAEIERIEASLDGKLEESRERITAAHQRQARILSLAASNMGLAAYAVRLEDRIDVLEMRIAALEARLGR